MADLIALESFYNHAPNIITIGKSMKIDFYDRTVFTNVSGTSNPNERGRANNMRNLNQRGSFIIWFTVAMALLGTFIGFALDFGRAYLEKARLARLVDGASLAAAKVLKGQTGFQNEATRAACDSMAMNGAPVVMSGSTTCAATNGTPMTASVEFFDLAAAGGPAVRAVRVTGTEPVSTTFLRFLGWMVPGDFSTINVVARAEAGPERPVDLMLVLDRSGSMKVEDSTGKRKIDALKCALTGQGCTGDGFLGENFTADDRVGMTAFGKRGCGTGGSNEFMGDVCVPDKVLGSSISSIVADVNGLGLSGTTNTMEGLRTGKTQIANAFADPSRVATRKVVLLVTDGQPTALRLDSTAACQTDPLTGSPLGGPSWSDDNGCIFVKIGGSTSPGVSEGLDRVRLNTNCERRFGASSIDDDNCAKTTAGSGNPNSVYLHQMQAARNAAREEARQIKELGGGNAVIFAIAIGPPTDPDATARLDANARCLLAAITNDKNMIEDGSTNQESGSCNAVYTTPDQDPHSDLTGAGKPAFNPNHQRGKLFIIDLNGDVQTQLQIIFNEIAAILKLRLVT
ncbi:MAG: pilus assembly protein TadG-related protein [Candidatus Binatia bacterium]